MAQVKKLIAALNAIVEHNPASADDFLAAEHDIIYLPAMADDVPEDSPLGEKLDELGAFIDSESDSWAMFT